MTHLLLDKTFSFRTRLAMFMEQPRTQKAIFYLILLNALVLGLELNQALMATHGELLYAIDNILLSIFVAEIALRIYAHGKSFFSKPWNIFDFLVVAVSLVPASAGTSVFRVLRVLRVLRMISLIPSMREIVDSLFKAIPGVSSTLMILLVFYYVFGVMSTQMFSEIDPTHYGTFTASVYSLFQIMMTGWANYAVDPIVEQEPWAWFFFIPFVLIVKLAVLNVIVGVIVGTMQATARRHAQKMEEKRLEERGELSPQDQLLVRLETIEKKLDQLSKD